MQSKRYLQNLEGKFSKIIAKISANTYTLIEEDDFANLISFVAFQYMRHPNVMEMQSQSMIELDKMMLEISLQSEQRWCDSVASMPEEDYRNYLLNNYESMQERFENGKYDFKTNNNILAGDILEKTNVLLMALLDRSWVIYVANDKAGDFVTSDFPVTLRWTEMPLPNCDLGFGDRNTEVIFPLTKNIALVGSFKDESKWLEANALRVSVVNHITVKNAKRFVYSSTEEFQVLKADGTIGKGSDLLFRLTQTN